ncbi:MAG: tetratricopeptide repeat protein [Planctomycetota bacterium]
MADARKGEHHADRAREMLRQGRIGDAERELRAAVASDPTRGDWMLHLGWTLEATGRNDEALQQYRQSATLLPTARDPKLAQGLLLVKMGRNGDAVAPLEGVLKIDPRCETAISFLIRALRLLGRHEEAETAYYMALQAIERPATSHLEIARSLVARGDLKRAEHCFRRAIAEGPALVGVRVELAQILLQQDRAKETALLLAEEFRRGPVPSTLALEIARIHIAAGREDEATQVLDQLARAEPSNPRLHLLLVRAMRRRGDLARAARHAEIASKLANDLPGLDLEKAHLARIAGARRFAAELAKKEIAERGAPPERREFLETIALLLDGGDAAEAKRLFDARFGAKLRISHGSDKDLLRIGARIALATGDLREGRARSRRLLRLEPGSIPAIHNLALIALERRAFGLSAAWLAKGLALAPTDAGLRKLRTLWWWRRATRGARGRRV